MSLGAALFAGRYQLLNKLGEGGMGVVFLAQDMVLDRRIALKIPHAHLCADEGVISRFLREARMAAQMENHPNFCRIYDVSQADGRPFLTMDYIDGTPLSKLIGPANPWSVPQGVDLVRQLALALQALHGQGIIHRDLKPSNVMLRADGTPVLMDFGLARPVARIETTTNHPLGTPAYMAPEQVKGDRSDLGPATDIYGLGVMLFQLVTGQVPYRGPLHHVFAQIIAQPPPAPSTLRAGIDGWLDRICLQAMAKEPLERPASMAEFAAVLQQYLQHTSQAASDPTLIPLPVSHRRPTPPPDPTLLSALGRPEPATPPPPVAVTIVDPPPSLHDVSRPPPATVRPLDERQLQPQLVAAAVSEAHTLDTLHVDRPAAAAPVAVREPRLDRLMLPRPRRRMGWLLGLAALLGGGALALFLIRPPTAPSPKTPPTLATAATTPALPAPQWITRPPSTLSLPPGGSTVFVVGVKGSRVVIDAHAVDGAITVVARSRLAASLGPEPRRANEIIIETGRPDVWGLDAIPVAVHVGDAVSPGTYPLRLLARTGDSSPVEAELRLRVEGTPLAASFEEGGISMVRVPAGFYRMGSNEERDTRPAHPVILPRPFYLSAGEVSERQYRQLLKQPADGATDRPQQGVSFADAVAFCDRLKGQRVYRLPTEAEWEYACRAGQADSPHHWPEGLTAREAVFGGVESPRALAGRVPNRWGLFDMHGNVREWCSDWYSVSYYEECVRTNQRLNPKGPAQGSYERVARGGAYIDSAADCTSHRRFRIDNPQTPSRYVGLRLLAEAP